MSGAPSILVAKRQKTRSYPICFFLYVTSFVAVDGFDKKINYELNIFHFHMYEWERFFKTIGGF